MLTSSSRSSSGGGGGETTFSSHAPVISYRSPRIFAASTSSAQQQPHSPRTRPRNNVATAAPSPSLSPRSSSVSNSTPTSSVRAAQLHRHSVSPVVKVEPAATSSSWPNPERGVPNPVQPATTDAGTQYTPPDWPPTSALSSRHPSNTAKVADSQVRRVNEIIAASPAPVQSSAAAPSDGSADSPEVSPTTVSEPSEPQLRVTPHSSLSNASSARRSHADVASSDASSPSMADGQVKRARTLKADAKVMPKEYADSETKDLASLIADMLMELIENNDKIPLKDGHLTRFNSRAPPGISVHDYLQRLTFHATLPPPILLSMVYYIDRLCALYNAFTINSLTVHRFLITSATVASKGLSDSFWTNATYARVGGVTVKELALLELELLSRVHWKIVPKHEELNEYYRNLIARNTDFVMDGDQDDSETASMADQGNVHEAESGMPHSDVMDTRMSPVTPKKALSSALPTENQNKAGQNG